MSRAALEDLLADDVLSVANSIVGWTIESEIGGVTTSVVITEVEAYMGADDPASHAFRGRTPRNRSMFLSPGHLYVYRSYGIHWCMNVVVGSEGLPHAVLLRGGIPIAGEAEMAKRRGRAKDLANGPGKLCQALGVSGDNDGADLRGGPIRLGRFVGIGDRNIVATPRIGISKATKRLWRFVAVE